MIIKNLSCHYNETDVLSNLSFELPKGANLGIVGPSGSGKTTFLYIIASIIPDLLNANITGEIYGYEKVVLSMQNPGRMLSMLKETVYGETCFALENFGISDIHEKVYNILQEFNLWEKRDLNPIDLSGGEQQKLIIAGVLVQDFDLLCLDQPFYQLDDICKKHLILKLQQLTQSVILVEHDPEILAEVCDYILHLPSNKFMTAKEALTKGIYISPWAKLCRQQKQPFLAITKKEYDENLNPRS